MNPETEDNFKEALWRIVAALEAIEDILRRNGPTTG